MIVLDCESTDSIYGSLEAITGAQRAAIESFFRSNDLNSIYNGNSPPLYPANDFLLNNFKRAFCSDLSYDSTCWFHLTRTDATTNFEDGIIPLGQQLDLIWDWLYGLFNGVVSGQQWKEFRQDILRHSGHYAYLYRIKSENQFHWGPYAILVRDLAFKPGEVHNHDYFSGPEIVEDICFCFEKIYQVNLLRIFLAKTKPCIVKFIDTGTRTNYVRAALWHLHKIAWQEKCTDYCNDCFDGKGIPVRRNRIVSVEFQKYE